MKNLLRLVVCVAAVGVGLARADSAAPVKHVLFFTKSSGWEHSVIKRENGQPSWAEKILTEQGAARGVEFTFTKDGSLITPDYLKKFDAVMFYTTGDLTFPGNDKQPGITPEGKKALLDAIHHGLGFIGVHSAADTYHTNEPGGQNPSDLTSRYKNYGDKADPYIRMLGGEFIKHGAQQDALLHAADPRFPGAAELDGTRVHEEWYSLKDFSPDLHVILVMDTQGLQGPEYQRPPFPSTWAHLYGKGRVFYTAMGHREDVWTNPKFQDLLFGGIHWASRAIDLDVTPNLKEVAPHADQLPPPNPPEKK